MIKRILLPTAAAAMLLSGPVFAQPGPGGPGGYQAAPNGDFGPERGIQRRLQGLHDRLGISPAQQPQWDAVVGTLRENAQAMRGSPALQAVRSGRLNAVQELQALSDLARQRADAMQRLIPAVDALYAALSPEQRQVADQALQRLVHRGDHWGGHWGEHRHG